MASKVKWVLIVSSVLLLGLVLLAPVASADKKKVDAKYKDKYQNIEVTRFDVKEGVDFPADWMLTMTEEIVKQLQETKKLKQVLRESETPTDPAAPTLKLTGTVTQYDKGSRAARYMIGFGAGKTKVVAHIKIADKATGEVLFEDDVDGKVIIGVIGGESVGATRGLAKEVAGKTKKEFFK